MSRAATLSVLGLYEWDNTLFDLMILPEALDKDTLVTNLLAELAEMEVIYPNPVVMKNLIGVWSAKQIDIWNRLYQTTQYEYNPIENYDRYESGSNESTDEVTHSGLDTHADRITLDGEDTVSGDRTDSGYIAGFDSAPSGDDDGLVKKTRDESEASTTTEYGKIEDRTGNYGYGHKIKTETDGEHELHIHGNIGTVTAQKMIMEQREIEKFNLYDIIIDDFRMRFCILVY